jgi:hypothetical protein
MDTPEASGHQTRLDEISTDWEVVRDPGRFVLRYAPAIHHYLAALIRNPHDVEDVAQDFFLRVAQHGFLRTKRTGGRFRDYLKVAVRNAAVNFLHRTRRPSPTDAVILQATMPNKAQAAADHAWVDDWRRCLLDRTRRAMEKRQSHSRGSLSCAVLSMLVENPLDDMKTLADRTSALVGRPIRAEAFRQQVSRARYLFAELLVKEVARTLDHPTTEQVKEELADLALWDYIRDFLPTHQRGERS